ncbi:0e950a54-ae88-49ed-b301-bb4646c78e53 [Sclerotinia trifoliorum]|uniref:0e950a54-ae88-49ed-b301-bb4646c78e53 n=1 Tax=Sclerotinia trifoliorum TaxID=28548 RepID=A0A8H2VLG0_9HELO|nr:0e950a54-ae88-49ed-b301-bb4646c78e53 [Sclerotinia trifoliorum]
MHFPSCNAEERPEVLHEFIRQNPLGILTTAIKSDSYPFLQNSHIPWLVDADFDGNTNGLGRLRGHIARQNPQAKAIIESCTAVSESSSTNVLEHDVLVLFNGPVHHYVTPKFYKQTKPDTGKVVPTWDYEAVEVYGRARVYYDTKSAESGSFLAKQISDLSDHMETSIMGYGKTSETHPWRVADAPERYIELLTKNIIGIEIEITSMAGRFKWSQEKPVKDRDGLIEGFKNLDTHNGALLSEKVRDHAALFDAKKAASKLGA